MLVLRAIVYAFAFVCCHVAFHITCVTCVYIAGVVCFRGVGLFACVGLLVRRVMVYAFVLLCCKVLFPITSVYIAYVFCFRVIGLFACVCMIDLSCDCVCVCLLLLQCCVPSYTCVYIACVF